MSLYIKYEIRCDFCTHLVTHVQEHELSPTLPGEPPISIRPNLGYHMIGCHVACGRCIDVAIKAIRETPYFQRRVINDS